uniref:C-type lectin domain-containing protein n=1 Tax=Periophthalmus magnuspinnatus TaxID=409849 RepID=A0A3B3ZYG3_9GOBI
MISIIFLLCGKFFFIFFYLSFLLIFVVLIQFVLSFCTGKTKEFCPFTAGHTKQYHYIATALTWAEAVLYCRQHYTDLAMIESSSENTMMTSVFATSGSYYTWIGLYRETLGIWSDGTSLTFTRWGAIGTGQQCVAEDSAHLWFPQSCDQTLPFFCHGGNTL